LLVERCDVDEAGIEHFEGLRGYCVEPEDGERAHGSVSVLVCLVPVRNAAGVLGEWLDEARRFADAVIALDDGSVDETRQILTAHPLVAEVLTNGRRNSYLGWHDGVNRNRLLAAAGEHRPDWVFFLDVDERLDATDAHALRKFVETEPVDSCAYGFRVHRMLEGEHYDPAYEVVYRLFRFRAGQRLPPRRLNLRPVPVQIPAVMETTLRIKHYGEVGEEGRQARIDKLRQADPEGSFLSWYNNLPPLSPGPHPKWTPRDPDGPVLAATPKLDGSGFDLEAEMAALDLDGPVLTVAVLTAPGEETEAMMALARLRDESPLVATQLLLVCAEPGTGRLPERADGIDVIVVPAGATRAAMANAGLQAAGGDYITFLTLPVTIDCSGLAAVVAAHNRGHALVGGTLVDHSSTPTGRAGALLDQPVAGGPPVAPAAAFASFSRDPLRGVGGFDEQTAVPETLAVRRLARKGLSAVVLPELRFAHRQPSSAGNFLSHRYRLGRTMVSDHDRSWPEAATEIGRVGATAVRRASGRSREFSDEPVAGPAARLAVIGLVGAGTAATCVGAAREALQRPRPVDRP
jgi:hypothetical protein